MAKLPWFPFYPMDYLSDPVVCCMTLEEQGAYTRLLCHAWNPPSWNGERAPIGSLPNDAMLLSALAGTGGSASGIARWEELSTAVMRAFNESPDGKFIVQKRLTEEYLKHEAGRMARVKAGKLGGKRKASNARVLLDVCQGFATSKSLAKPSQSQSQSQSDTSSRKAAPKSEKKDRLPFSREEALTDLQACQRLAWPPEPESRDWADLAAVIRTAKTRAALQRVVSWLTTHETYRDTLTVGVVRKNLGAWLTASEKPDSRQSCLRGMAPVFNVTPTGSAIDEREFPDGEEPF